MTPPREHGLDWNERQKQALTVACRVSYCAQPEGTECVDPHGQPLVAQPAHWQREEDSAAMTGEQPLFMLGELPEPVDSPPPAPRAKGVLSKHRDRCEHCHGRLLWARTVNERAMPLDAEPSDSGNVLVTEVAGHFRAEVIGKRATAAALRAAGHRTHVHHAATCPYASKWHTKR